MYLLPPMTAAPHDSHTVGHDLTGSGARTCTRARRAPLPDMPQSPEPAHDTLGRPVRATVVRTAISLAPALE